MSKGHDRGTPAPPRRSQADAKRDPSGANPQGQGGNLIPGFILALQRQPLPRSPKIGPEAKAVMAVLWRDSQNKTRPSDLTNQEIAERSQVGQTEQNVNKHLRHLEANGVIQRIGDKRNRKIAILISPPEGDDSSFDLLIPAEIHNAHISTPQKFVLTVMGAFRRVHRWQWWPKRIGMKPKTFLHNYHALIQKFGVESETIFPPNPKLFFPKTESIFPPIKKVEVGRVSGRGLSNDKLTAYGRSGGDNMETLDSPDYSKINYRRHTKPSPEPKISPEDIEELNAVMSLPGIVRHKKGTKAYAASARVIRVLKHSAKHTLGSQQLTRIRAAFKDRATVNRGQVEEFLGKKFDAEERMDLYRRLSMDRNKTGQKPMSLADALISYTGYCTLMYLWYFPPKLPKVITQYSPPDSIEDIMPLAMEFCRNGNEKEVRYNICKLYHFWQREVLPHYNDDEEYHYKRSFYLWMKGMLNYWSDRYGSLDSNPGWFTGVSRAVAAWRRWTKEGESHDAGQYFNEDYDGESEFED